MVMQDPKYSLNPVMTIGDQLLEAARGIKEGAAARQHALGMLASVRIRDPERVYRAWPHELSGGMGQRAMIAMMLMAEPELLIADEPTSALDVTVRLQVLAILDDLVKTRHMGLIFISHDLNLVRTFCDRVLVMYARAGAGAADCQRAGAGEASLHPRPAGLSAGDRPSASAPAGAAARSIVDGAGFPMSALSTQPMIEIENLSISFGHGADRVDAVKTVSFSVAPGESYGLVGESGSGKSTILRALAGLNPFWSGHMAIAGQKLTGKRPRALRRLVQMVFQDPFGSLHPKHTVDRILSEPLAIHGFEDVETRVRAALERVGLGPSFRFRYPHQLSGGQRQRVAIARALILEPKVVLLDEPTSALDVSIQAEVLNLLTDLRQQLGLTYVLVSHDLGVVAHMCKRLSIMRTGEVVETASADDLSEGRLLHAYSRQLLIASRGYDTQAIAAFGDF